LAERVTLGVTVLLAHWLDLAKAATARLVEVVDAITFDHIGQDGVSQPGGLHGAQRLVID